MRVDGCSAVAHERPPRVALHRYNAVEVKEGESDLNKILSAIKIQEKNGAHESTEKKYFFFQLN
jgi:hypothetical protein